MLKNSLLMLTFVLIELMGIFGNLFVICSVQFDVRMKRSVTNKLIVRVAMCDLFILLFNLPDLIRYFFSSNGNWIYNELSCRFIRTILVLCQYSSVLTMCILTFERFIGIVYPFREKFLQDKKHFLFLTILIWIFSLICSSPNFLFLKVIYNEEQQIHLCLLEYSSNNRKRNFHFYLFHKTIESILFYFIPLILQIYSFIRIAKQLSHIDQSLQTTFDQIKKNASSNHLEVFDQQRRQHFEETSRSRSSTSITTIKEFSLISTKKSSIQQISKDEENLFFVKQRNSPKQIKSNTLQSRRNVIKMLFIVVLIYFISFSPQIFFFILFETNFIREIPSFFSQSTFIALLMLLLTFNSASNPIVYLIFCSKFRQSFLRIIRRIFFCFSSTTNSSNQRKFSLQLFHKSEQQRHS